jgi:hypothetical protein
MTVPRNGLCSLAIAICVATTARAQVTRVVGHVRDSAGAPIAATQVSSVGRRTLTDSAGRFALELPLGAIVINFRRLGFEPRDSNLTISELPRDSLVMILVALPQELEGITSQASRLVLVDFFRHKGSGGGRYLDRDQIEAFHAQKTSDIMRRMPGLSLVPDRNGRFELRMRGNGSNCPPDFWIDGVRAPFLNVDDLPLEDVEALEIYNGPAGLPPEYLNRFGNPACGAIVIWTRLPG